MKLSKCCKSEVGVGGEGTTHYYVCDKCNKACDTIEQEDQEEIMTDMFGEGGKEEVKEAFKTPTPNDWIEEKMKEVKEEFVKDFCEIKPYRDTDLIYFKGFCDKNYNLIPTPKTIMQWYEENLKSSLTQQKEAIEKEKTEKYNWGREVGIKECLEIIKGFESGKIVDLIEKIKSLIQ
jgi:hypothetical protein